MGNFFDDLFNKVFKPSQEGQMNHKENFTLKTGEDEDAKAWSESDEGIELIALISKNYELKKLQINERPQVHILDSKYAKGFAISYEAPLSEKTFSMLFLAFAQRVLALGYQQVSLDRKMEEVNDQVKSTEKFYFKPPLQIPVEGELISQLYGNIAIEKVSLDNEPNFLKVLTTYYSDRLYSDPKPFDQFIERLFETKPNG